MSERTETSATTNADGSVTTTTVTYDADGNVTSTTTSTSSSGTVAIQAGVVSGVTIVGW